MRLSDGLQGRWTIPTGSRSHEFELLPGYWMMMILLLSLRDIVNIIFICAKLSSSTWLLCFMTATFSHGSLLSHTYHLGRYSGGVIHQQEIHDSRWDVVFGAE